MLRLPDRIHSQLGDEYVTLEIDTDTSASAGFVDGGELGDTVMQASEAALDRTDAVSLRRGSNVLAVNPFLDMKGA